MTDFLNWDLNDIPEKQPIDPCVALVEVKLARMTKSNKTGRTGLQLMYLIDAQPDAAPIFETCWLPMEGDIPDNANILLGMLRDTYKGLGYDFANITGMAAIEEYAGELVGIQTRAKIGYEPKNDEKGYAAKNTIDKLLGL